MNNENQISYIQNKNKLIFQSLDDSFKDISPSNEQKVFSSRDFEGNKPICEKCGDAFMNDTFNARCKCQKIPESKADSKIIKPVKINFAPKTNHRLLELSYLRKNANRKSVISEKDKNRFKVASEQTHDFSINPFIQIQKCVREGNDIILNKKPLSDFHRVFSGNPRKREQDKHDTESNDIFKRIKKRSRQSYNHLAKFKKCEESSIPTSNAKQY